MMPANIVFGRELLGPCDLLYRAPPDKGKLTTAYVTDLEEQLHDIHHLTH
jgi:hypothetical protein